MPYKIVQIRGVNPFCSRLIGIRNISPEIPLGFFYGDLLMSKAIIKAPNGEYLVNGSITGRELIQAAIDELKSLKLTSRRFENPSSVKEYLSIHLGAEQREVFSVIFLTNQHQLLSFEKLFYGTVNQSEVHPREIVKRCLELNAVAVILAHNHPSGEVSPSPSDRHITEKVVNALQLVDVRVLDHVIIGGANSYSFAEHGLI